MKIRKKQLAQIITETVEDTAKDLTSIAQVLTLIAETTLDVIDALSSLSQEQEDTPLEFQNTTGRNIKRAELTGRVVSTYTDRFTKVAELPDLPPIPSTGVEA
jgi:hypothetical protein